MYDMNDNFENENTDLASDVTPETEVVESEEEWQGQEEGLLNKDEYIPKNVALQWKRELKEYKRQLNQYKEKDLQYEQQNRIEDIKKKVIAKGYDADFAELLAEVSGDLISTNNKVYDPIEVEVMEELEELAEDYPGIIKQKKEIVEKIKRYRKADPDFSVDDAIRLLGNGKKSNKSAKEIELEVEQRQLLSRRNQDKTPTPSSAGSVKEQYPLDADDIRVLRELQSHHPASGWTKKKYFELMIKNKRR